jgi:phosphoribosylformylglycinamidine synthase subunit PurQ / glutaminase
MSQETSALVLAGNGTNCERETAHACTMGGFGKVDIATVWEWLHGDVSLERYHLLMFPGGFLDGDDLGSAKAQANRFLHSIPSGSSQTLVAQVVDFIKDGKLIMGICNGFQLMVKLGLLPALDGDYGMQTVTLTNNDSGRFEDRWVSLQVNMSSPCVFTKGLERLYLPVRHGEGKLVTRDSGILDELQAAGQVVLRYADQSSGEPTNQYPENPNGSQAAIAGLCDPSGRLFGLMPHPEAYLFRTNHPRWTREDVPAEGMGLAMFRNACEYVKSNL